MCAVALPLPSTVGIAHGLPIFDNVGEQSQPRVFRPGTVLLRLQVKRAKAAADRHELIQREILATQDDHATLIQRAQQCADV